MTWWNEYIGIPFQDKGRTREGCDCLGLVRLVLLEQFKIEVPSLTESYDDSTDSRANVKLYEDSSQEFRKNWKRVNEPQAGDAIVLLVDQRPVHIGIVTEPGWFLHVDRHAAACVESYLRLPWSQQVDSFWRYQAHSPIAFASGTIHHRPGLASLPNAVAPVENCGKVRVHCKLHPFKEEKSESFHRPGSTVARILRELKIPRELNANVLVNGSVLAPEAYSTTRVWDTDFMSVRVVPGFGNNGTLRTLGSFSLGAGSLALYYLLTRSSKTDADQATIQQNLIAPPPPPLPPPPPERIEGSGGSQSVLIPQIMGLRNRPINNSTIPCIFAGSTGYRVFPVVAADQFVITKGREQWLHVVLSCGYGYIEMSDIKIGKRPISEFVAEGSAYEVRNGAPGDAALTLYVGDNDNKAIGDNLLYNVQVEKRAGQDADELNVDIFFPNGLYSDSPTEPGEKAVGFVYFDIFYRLAGSTGAWTQVGGASPSFPVGDLVPTAFTVSKSWTVTRGLYDVRVKRTTISGGGAPNTADASQWSTLRSIKYESPIRPFINADGSTAYVSYLALKIKASELATGVLDECSVLAKRRIRKWNGTTWTAPEVCAIPAWCLAEAIVGDCNGKQIPESMLDLPGLLSWANFTVSKGLEFYHPYEQPTTIQQMIRDICSAGRAGLTVVDGKISVIFDDTKPTVVMAITAANTRNFSFRQIYPDYPHAIRVNFINPEKEYQQDQRVVYADGYTEANATVYETVDYVGCVSADQAFKMGRYWMAAAKLRPATYECDMDVQIFIATRGDRVRVNHDVTFHGLQRSVIKSVAVDGQNNQVSITLEQKCEMVVGQTYAAEVRLADNTFMTRAVMTVAGESNTLTWSPAIPAATSPKPQAGDVVMFGFTNSTAVDMIVQSIEYQMEDLSAHITLVDYSPAIFNADTGTIPPFQSHISQQQLPATVVELPVVTSVVSDETVILKSEGTYTSRIQVSLQAPLNPQIQFVQWEIQPVGATQWSGSGSASASANSFLITGVQDNVSYNIRLRYVTSKNRLSGWTPINNHRVVGKTTKPPNVPSLQLQGDLVAWPYDAAHGVTVPIDFSHFIAKVNFGTSDNWDQATIISQRIVGNTFPKSLLPPGQVTVLVKAVDVAGNESASPAKLRLNFGDPIVANLQLEYAHHPAFSLGTTTNGVVEGGQLKAEDSGENFWGTDDSAPFWSGNDSDLFWNDSYEEMVYEFSFTPGYGIAKPFKWLLRWVITAENYKVEYRRAGGGLFWTGLDTDTFWTGSDSDPFWDQQEDPWLLYPQDGVEGNWEEFDVRITCYASSTMRSVIEQLYHILDVVDVIEVISRQLIPPGGGRLNLTKTFRGIKNVLMNVNFDASYPDAFQPIRFDDLISGPLIKVFDSNNADVGGYIDATVQGY